MSRAGYSDDIDQWALIRWRGQVASAIRGKRGQAFLLDLIAALDALPEKTLIAHDLEQGENVCAIGSVGRLRGIDMAKLNPEDHDILSKTFGIAEPLVREIEFENDEGYYDSGKARWQAMRDWAFANLKPENARSLARTSAQ